MNSEIRFLAQHLLDAGVAPLSDRDQRLIRRLAHRVHVARDLNQVFDERLTVGQRLSDRVATIGGSWCFIKVDRLQAQIEQFVSLQFDGAAPHALHAA